MEQLLRGKALVLGNNIDTDQIYPGRFLELTDHKQIGSHCFAGIDEAIAPGFPKGGIVVAGRNFGCGSSREHAPIALLNMGAAAVVANSFARIFYRNSINLGLPLLVCKGAAEHVKNGETVELDLKNGTLTCVESGEVLQGEVFGDFVLSILEAGGIKPLFRKKFSAEE